MTTATITAPRKGRTFGLYRVAAPLLTLAAFWLAFSTTDPSRALAAAGQGTMMLAVTIYAFRLKGRPVEARPPVHFPAEARACLAVLCFGALLWGFGVMGLAGGAMPTKCAQISGLLIALVPFSATFVTAVWLRTDGGREWRAGLVESA